MQPKFEYRLTERRKAHREAMAREVESLAAKHNWQCERSPYAQPHEIRLELQGPRGLAVSIEFERHSAMPDNYCMPWHFAPNASDRDAKLNEAFGRYQGSDINPFHRRKCTAFASGIDTLLDKLEVAMEMANGTSAYGSAFMEA